MKSLNSKPIEDGGKARNQGWAEKPQPISLPQGPSLKSKRNFTPGTRGKISGDWAIMQRKVWLQNIKLLFFMRSHADLERYRRRKEKGHSWCVFVIVMSFFQYGQAQGQSTFLILFSKPGKEDLNTLLRRSPQSRLQSNKGEWEIWFQLFDSNIFPTYLQTLSEISRQKNPVSRKFFFSAVGAESVGFSLPPKGQIGIYQRSLIHLWILAGELRFFCKNPPLFFLGRILWF